MKIWSWALVAVLALASFECRGGAPPGRRRLGGPAIRQRDATRGAPSPTPAAPAQNQQAAAGQPARRQPGRGRAQASVGRHARRPGRGPGPGLAGEFAGPGRSLRPVPDDRPAGDGRHGRDRLHHAARRKAPAEPPAAGLPGRGCAGRPAHARRASTARTTSATTPRPGRGNATPWPSTPAQQPAQAAPACRSARRLAGSQTWGVPAGFDTEGFLAAAKRNFVTLQDAWDRARHRQPALDDDRRHAGRDPSAAGRAREATRAASRTRPRW